MTRILTKDTADKSAGARRYVEDVFRPILGFDSRAEVTPTYFGEEPYYPPITAGYPSREPEPFLPDIQIYRDPTEEEAGHVAASRTAPPELRRPSEVLLDVAVAGVVYNNRTSDEKETTAYVNYPQAGIAGLYKGANSEVAYTLATEIESMGAKAHRESIGVGKFREALANLLLSGSSQETPDADRSTAKVRTDVLKSATVRVIKDAARRAIVLASFGTGEYNIFYLRTNEDGLHMIEKIDVSSDSDDGFREIEMNEKSSGDRIIITTAETILPRDLLAAIGGNHKMAESIASSYQRTAMVVSIN